MYPAVVLRFSPKHTCLEQSESFFDLFDHLLRTTIFSSAVEGRGTWRAPGGAPKCFQTGRAAWGLAESKHLRISALAPTSPRLAARVSRTTKRSSKSTAWASCMPCAGTAPKSSDGSQVASFSILLTHRYAQRSLALIRLGNQGNSHLLPLIRQRGTLKATVIIWAK